MSNQRKPIMPNAIKWVDAPARLFISLLFLVSGFGKITKAAATQAYMVSYGVPGVLVWPAAAWELGAGLALLIGFGVCPLAFLLAGWCVLTALIFHTNFAAGNQMFHFFKNLTMCGGFLIIARTGAPGFGLDGLLAARRPTLLPDANRRDRTART